MKKIFLFAAIAAIMSGFAMAQEPDLELIAKMREIKGDSATIMLGKVYGTQTAMNHTTAEARQSFLKAFTDMMNLDQKNEFYLEGKGLAEQFYRNSENVNKQLGIHMSRKAFAQAFLTRFSDTTSTVPINDEMRDINKQAKRLMEEIGELKKDSIAPQTALIELKADSLSQNMGNFFGAQMQNVSKKKNLNEGDIVRLLDGFNSSINIDENDKPLVDGTLLASEYRAIEQKIKRQLGLNLNKDTYIATVASVLNDPKVPTKEDFKEIDSQTQAYMTGVQAFAKENSPEALTQKGLGKKYIENQMEKDPKFIQAPSGLVYKILTPGNGKKFNETDKIKVMYKGTHVDGTTFDESKEPVAFAPNQVVPGFKEALLMMSPGAKMIAILPYNIAYGDRGAGKDIKPFETLVFEIETLGIDDSAPAAKPAATKKEEKVAADKPAGKVNAKPADKAAAKPVTKTPATKEEKTSADNQKLTKKSTGKKGSSKKATQKRKTHHGSGREW
ncbi:MAG: FKBP-type peptidyl-prolyl cis-trans isomerase [Muribaculaceae bacterium]|nr:FKBP-type peptidyl-prolyl cis-trans isomerase [Muribaculaceae bacterium]